MGTTFFPVKMVNGGSTHILYSLGAKRLEMHFMVLLEAVGCQVCEVLSIGTHKTLPEVKMKKRNIIS